MYGGITSGAALLHVVTDAEAEAGRFRSDLFYRLNVIELRLPPLRERSEDIPYLTAAFIREFASKFGKSIEGLHPEAERALMTRAWLGNVRELRNVLERSCMLAEGLVLTERDIQAALPLEGGVPRPQRRPSETGGEDRTLTRDLHLVERDHIVRVLADAQGNKRAAAERLGLSRRTLYRRLERYHLLEDSEPRQ